MTDTVSCTCEIQVPIKLVADAFSTAFEAGHHGCMYWLPKARPPKGLMLTKAELDEHCNWYSTPRTWTPGHGYIVTIWELVDEGSGKLEKHEIDIDKIGERLQAFATANPELFGRFLGSEDDPLDGWAADEVVQMIVLGETRYG